MMLKEVLAQQTSIVSKLHVTETERLSLSKSKGKDSTHEETRKVVKPYGPGAELNKNVCTMLPTTSDVNSHDSHNCSRPKHRSMSRMSRRLPIVLNGSNTLNIKSMQHK